MKDVLINSLSQCFTDDDFELKVKGKEFDVFIHQNIVGFPSRMFVELDHCNNGQMIASIQFSVSILPEVQMPSGPFGIYFSICDLEITGDLRKHIYLDNYISQKSRDREISSEDFVSLFDHFINKAKNVTEQLLDRSYVINFYERYEGISPKGFNVEDYDVKLIQRISDDLLNEGFEGLSEWLKAGFVDNRG